jgi:hypothetical protein
MRLTSILLLLILFLSCKQKSSKSDGVIPPKKMESILLDYINAEAYAKELCKMDSSKNDTIESVRLQTLVFKKHKITRSVFYKNFDYYNNHPDLMMGILDSIIAHHSKTEKEIRKRLFFKEYE